MMTMKHIYRLMACLALLGLAAACGGKSDASKVFEFNSSSTKDVAIHAIVELLATDDAGAKIDTEAKDFVLNSFVKDGGEFRAVGLEASGLSLTGSEEGLFDVPVTLSGSSYEFDAIVKVPKSVEAEEGGYSFLFTLKDAEDTALRLAGEDITGSLRSFKTQVLPGRAPSENEVPISLSTTVVADLMDALEVSYTKESYDEIMAAIDPILSTARGEVDLTASHKILPYVTGLVARTMMLLASDTTAQESLVGVVTKSSGSTAASNVVMTQISKVMSDLSTNSATIFASETDKDPLAVFKTATSTQISDAAKKPVFDTVYTPLSVAFVDKDTSAKIGGSVVITPKVNEYAPAGYAAYLGGNTKTAITLVSLGTVKLTSGAKTATLVVANGTSVPTGATSIWVYPLAEDDSETDAPKVVTFENVSGGGTATTPTMTLTGPTTIADNATVTLVGTCSPSGSSIAVTSPTGFTPASGTCSCTSGALASCTVFTDTGFSPGTAQFTAIITKSGLTATRTLDVTVESATPPPTETFGAPFGNYMEDGAQSVCVKVSDIQITCKGGYFAGDNDVTATSGWTSGATIRGYYNLEATTFIEDSAGDIWSVGNGPIGRTTSGSTLGKITFAGKHSGTRLTGIHGEHQRASALFNDGQVFSWAGTASPAERLATGAHTLPVKYLYEGYGHECFIDNVNALYCKDSSPSTAAFQWTPTSSDLALAGVSSLSMPWNHSSADWDIVIRKTNGAIYTAPRYTPVQGATYTNTGITSSSSAGLFGFTPAAGTEEFLVVGNDGKIYNKSGALTVFGTTNRGVGVSYGGVGGRRHFVLSGDGKLYGAVAATMSGADALGGYTDIESIRAFYGDICGIRSNGEIRCSGNNTGGSFSSPTLMGTIVP